MTTTTARPASPKQTAFIQRLLADREVPAATAQIIEGRIDGYTSREASLTIDMLLGQPNKATASSITEDGMYRTPDGDIFKVQRSQSGNLYAKALVEDEGGNWHFQYAAGAVRRLTPAMRMTLEQAKEFGVLYGTCCVCGRTLTDEGSIAAGIGPICAAKF